MPSAKSGSAGSADSPADPDQALEAADANPGDTTSTQANPAQTQSKQWKQAQVDPDGEDDDQEEKNRDHWISIDLKDDHGNPVPNEPYEVKLSDGTIRSGTLDQDGRARVGGIPEGQCDVRFPKMHNREWRKA